MHSRDRSKVVLAMVGLPARGKTYTARKIARYLSWLGHKTRVFNVGSYRREHFGASQPHEFFDPSNAQGRAALFDMAVRALTDMTEWLASGGEVAIYDATNSTRGRRQLVSECCANNSLPLVFVESICDDPSVIAATIRETKTHSPDYSGMDPEDAAADFRARIAHYERAYEPITDTHSSFIKIVDVGRQVVLNRITGHLPARLAPLLINMHIGRRPIWLTRHGESLSNLRGAIGGDSELTLRGETYARALADFMRSRSPTGDSGPPSRHPSSHSSRPPPSMIPPADSPIVVWTSTLRRTAQTAAYLTKHPIKHRALDEIDAGLCDGMTYAEIKTNMPAEYEARKGDKFHYRYPRGESYEDVIQRLDPVIIELERQRQPILVIAHQAILRAMYGYFMDRPPEDIPHIEIPLHTVIQLTPTAYGCEEKRFPLLTITESDLTASSS